MARNYKTHRYPQPRIARGSLLARYLEEDAARTGVSVNILIPIRLLEYYEGSVHHQVPEKISSPSVSKSVPAEEERAEENALAFLSDDD